MVKHIILWQLKDEYSDAEKADIKAGIKAGLEGLALFQRRFDAGHRL